MNDGTGPGEGVDRVPSLYHDTVRVDFAPGAPLVGEHRADVCVVGGGVTGCSAALHLAERGYRVKLVEARRIGSGASGRSGGHALPGLGVGMDMVRDRLGLDAARRVWDLTRESVALTESLIERHAIPCDLKRGYVHAALTRRHVRNYHAWMAEMARDYDYRELEWLDRRALRERVRSDQYIGGVREAGGRHFHPLNYTLGLARAAREQGVAIHEDSAVVAIEQGEPACVKTATGSVTADFVVLGCNAYLDELDPALRAKIMPVGNYIIATEPLSDEQIAGTLPRDDAVSDANFVLDYYRISAERRLVYGGQVSYDGREPRHLRQRMEGKMARLFPVLRGTRIDYMWGGWVGITLNRFPHFGRRGRNLYFAHGYSGHGMTMAGLAGQLLAEVIAGQAERFDVLASMRHRDFPGGRYLRTPLLVLATTYYRLRDLL